MSSWTIYAGGKAKPPFDTLCKRYLQKLESLKVTMREIEGKQWQNIIKHKSQRWIMWDEVGVQYSSPEFWKKLDSFSSHALCFFIGEASGIPQKIFNQADEVWSLGPMTWPHLWARTMVLEQLYRKVLANKGHPYSFV
ncbi:23S rRNA (pseudouridine(1915)-N(3))-methyltransferase RlmH [Holospora curviuscula]|uniref:Ribosomal RNA large subunit methyltransferase H n=1 Tax=Holospora curviuscula TaxID=1082868 RepID=A0A2S5RHW5_9PROT|nr:23S rRNA (pseudouridine(1915)-N(3))-methyltransferase RlmH [Holospora curviuscula]PPE06924.1 Ribosomal RNA large subunit methyltransferase H [Holospora curviuscula]